MYLNLSTTPGHWAKYLSNMSKPIKRVVIYVEFEDGKVHQVLSDDVQKDLALSMLTDNEGKLNINEKPEDFTFYDPEEPPITDN